MVNITIDALRLVEIIIDVLVKQHNLLNSILINYYLKMVATLNGRRETEFCLPSYSNCFIYIFYVSLLE